MFTRIKRFRESLSKRDLLWFLLLANVIIWAVAYNQTNTFYNHYVELLTKTASASSVLPESNQYTKNTQTLQPTPSQPSVGSKEWILWKVKEEGLDPIKVNCLITNESGWDVNAKFVNDGGSVDLGLYQWNTKYQIDPGYISVGCIGNPECETYKFIEKVKKDGNFLAWHGYTNNCQWLGTSPFIN